MNRLNYICLTRQLRALGASEGVREALKTAMESRATHFTLRHTAHFGQDDMQVSLFVRKWKGLDLYYLQKCLASVLPAPSFDMRAHHFYFSHFTPRFILRELYHLLMGRYLYREILIYKGRVMREVWIKIDLSCPHLNDQFRWRWFSGYDLTAVLDRFPIWDGNDPLVRQGLIRSLKQGERAFVLIDTHGILSWYYIAACPECHTLLVYDEQQIPLSPETIRTFFSPYKGTVSKVIHYEKPKQGTIDWLPG